LLGICLARDRIRQMRHSAGMRRRSPAGETCHRQIKTAPKKMHWAAFAAEMRAELLKHAVTLHKNAPKPMRILASVRARLFMLAERNRALDLVRHRMNCHR